MSDPVCSVPAPKWSGEVRLRSGGDPYARITQGPTVIKLGGASAGGVSQAAIESAGLRVAGVVDDPSLYLARPTLLSGFVVPHASTPIAWTETTTADRVVVSLDVSDTFEHLKAAEAVVACESLTGAEPTFDARAFAAPPARRFASLREESMLVAGLGERNGAHVEVTSGRVVEVVATQGDMTRIVIDNRRYVVVGWVPTARLGESRITRPPRVRMAATSRHVEGDRRCAHDIPLIASVSGERAFVGTLPAGSSFTSSTVDIEPGFVEVAVFEPWFQMMGDAKLLAQADDVSGC